MTNNDKKITASIESNHISQKTMESIKNKLYSDFDVLSKKVSVFTANALENKTRETDFIDRSCSYQLGIQEEALNKHLVVLLNKTKLAIKKIENNTYGFCMESGNPIEEERLIANPTALYTLETQSRLESLTRK